jgi:hypothetical protein
MTFISSALRQCIGITTIAILLVDVVLAQTPQPERAKLRQPAQSTVQQLEGSEAIATKSREVADRKTREIDRRLSRVLRSICIGC